LPLLFFAQAFSALTSVCGEVTELSSADLARLDVALGEAGKLATLPFVSPDGRR